MAIRRRYDIDGSGRIELGEFRKLVAEIQAFHTATAGDDVRKVCVADDSHVRELRLCTSTHVRMPRVQVFLAYDRDRSGTIDARELQAALAELGLPTDSEQVSTGTSFL